MRPHRTFGKSPATCVSLYALSKTSSRNLETPSWFEAAEELISDHQNAARNLNVFVHIHDDHPDPIFFVLFRELLIYNDVLVIVIRNKGYSLVPQLV